ncbi:hypothetical protein [Paenibacillus apiarius]|uniref:Phage protein n=1 Tax=Paenibacillus apiarius TaxID=46240 RepID=A0ABT4DQS7_9BACL|nr:hypothetical protein [Paenibacillus apiarius]MCY9513314.1 hypothetical protein [Paenibacillus apiarius]MCY9519714.1 hypothetical protein [Paenibacillus apiarius]MCY9553230.1 hypothetical protein [Paenibacillus apiarius]MCY9557080.1 hypothetical protein [Paenibacillus apiarius]MCY9682179.1 hypothetical protein [Paenibacillus apiarius]
MYDVKPEINTLLESISGVTVSDAYPKDFNKLPHISFYEITNSDYYSVGPEYLTDISIQVDIWHNRSTGGLATAVTEKMNSIGFRRKLMADVPDPAGVKHKTMRFRGVVDKRTKLVHQ